MALLPTSQSGGEHDNQAFDRGTLSVPAQSPASAQGHHPRNFARTDHVPMEQTGSVHTGNSVQGTGCEDTPGVDPDDGHIYSEIGNHPNVTKAEGRTPSRTADFPDSGIHGANHSRNSSRHSGRVGSENSLKQYPSSQQSFDHPQSTGKDSYFRGSVKATSFKNGTLRAFHYRGL